MGAKEDDSADSLNSTTVTPKKERYTNTMMNELIVPTVENEEKLIDLHTDKRLTKMPTEWFLRRQKKSDCKGFYDFNCAEFLQSDIFAMDKDKVVKKAKYV